MNDNYMSGSFCKVLALTQFFLHLSIAVLCQSAKNKPAPPHYAVMVKARAQKDRILLRWAVNEPVAWKLANDYGFIVERYTVLRDGKINADKDRKLLTPVPLKPKPPQDFAALAEKNNEAAIIGQALYGKAFQVTGNNSKLAKIINQSDELNQRFTFSLVAADRNFEAAQMAGWGLTDSAVRAGEKYLYRIYAAVPKEKMRIDTSGVYLGLNDYEPLPQPKELFGKFGDKAVLLSWNYRLLKDIYTTYFIERSEDGINFSKLSDLPVANLNEKEDHIPSRMFYADSLKENNKKYFYRIKGLTSFGEVGPPSEAVSGEGKAMLTYVPHIKNADIINDSTANIEWEFAEEGTPLTDHFELNQSTTAKDGSFTILQPNISPTARITTTNRLLPTNYFTITAVDKNGNKRHSFPYLVQPVDSLPPAIPSGLAARIDSVGNVTLQWAANTEADLLGYVVLRSNTKTEEAAVLNSTPFPANTFKEKINIETLNRKIYYAVMALDRRMNQSVPCSFVELIKPDKIPPSSPIFKAYHVNDEGRVDLKWINSTSDDVEKHQLFRKYINEDKWSLIRTFSDSTQRYADDSVRRGEVAAYALIAVDKSGNESVPSPPLTVLVNENRKAPALKNFRAELLREAKTITLTWRYDNKDAVEYTIYRAENKDPFSVWRVIGAEQNRVEDREVMISNSYRYGIRATLKNGRMSEWKEVKVEF